MPTLSWNEIRQRAIQFSREWSEESREHAEAQTFWNEFFHVFGMRRRQVASFEEKVRSIKGQHRIDLFWKGKLLAEHKSRGEDLGKATSQAFNYIQELINEGRRDECPRYVAISDFQTIVLYDLEPDVGADASSVGNQKQTTLEASPPDVIEFPVRDLHQHIKHFAFMAGMKTQPLREQDPANLKAVKIMARLHDELIHYHYKQPDLERLLVRLLFCLFADDTGVFEPDSFHLYLENNTREDGYDLGPALLQLFETLDTPDDQRQHIVDEELRAFPYVNGELFSEHLHFPRFDRAMRTALLAACRFEWSKISPAIFGSLFQGVMDDKERRKLGAHYTSERDILKLIKPLFLDELTAEFHHLAGLTAQRRKSRLEAFQRKLGSLKFLDPACGCGNFLVIAYRELRKLELDVIKLLHDADEVQQFTAIELQMLSQVDVDQFYGIEIDMWPSRIAETALWLTDHQMNRELSEAFGQIFLRIPLKKSPHIICANALRTPWETILPPQQCSYILGNPPFVGKSYQSKEQKADLTAVAGDIKGYGLLDFVTAWYLLAADYMQAAERKGADASSIGNSPTQDASAPPSIGKATGLTLPASVSQEPTPIYFNPLAPIEITQGDLPHWEQQQCSYFVTFRLADSIPADKLKQWQIDRDNWLHRNPAPHDETKKEEYQREFGGKIQAWLMQGHGSCLLKHRESAELLAGAMQHFHQQRYVLHRASIMNNHVHVLVTPLPGHNLRDILHSWKSYTANKINALHKREGAFWQKESFDTIIRNADHLQRVLRYMDENAASPACVLDFTTGLTLPASVSPSKQTTPHGADASSIGRPPTQDASAPLLRAALVSTNSITMGEQVGVLWPALFAKGIQIHFAHRTFSWQSEASGAAHVHVVIIGFGLHDVEQRVIFEYENIKADGKAVEVSQINPLLIEGNETIILSRAKPICPVNQLFFGSKATDNGALILNDEEKRALEQTSPDTLPFVRPYLNSHEMINGVKRWCIWLHQVPPHKYRGIVEINARIKKVKEFRESSKKEVTRIDANRSYEFQEIRQPVDSYIGVPKTSSERRMYIPIGFLSPEVIAGSEIFTIPNATPYHFGVLTSAMHMAWVRQVAGRLKSDYRYSAKLVYNNYPWPVEASKEQQRRIEEAAEGVLAAREKYLSPQPHGADASSIGITPMLEENTPTQDASAPKCTLADLYDPLTMPADLLKAHQTLDRAVDLAYRRAAFHTERERVEFLFALYEQLTAPLAATPKKQPRRRKKPPAE